MKKFIYIFLFLITSTQIFAQSTWFKTYGGPRDDENYFVMTTKDNNILVVGYIKVYTQPNGVYIRQTCLTKFDLNGNILWQRLIGDSILANLAYGAAEDPFGNIFVPVISDYPRLFKYSSNGNLLWTKQYSDSLIWVWNKIHFTSDFNNIIISGTNQDLFYKINLTKLDTLGNITNYKVLSSEDSLNPYTGGYFVIKDDYIYIVYGQGSGPTFKGFVDKYDLNFNFVWRLIIPNSYGLTTLTNISDKYFIGLGFHWNPFHMYINKFDIYGNLLWGKEYDSLYHDNSIFKTLDNKIAVVGRINVDTAKFTILDTLGNVQKIVKNPFHADDVIDYKCITQTSDSSFVLVGDYARYDLVNYDCIVIKTDKNGNTVPLSINLNSELVKGIELTVYPNPFNSSVNIKINSAKNIKIEIRLFNILGQLIYSVHKNLSNKISNKILIDFSNLQLTSNLYFLQVIGENINYSNKLIYLK
jgi:hypothetical protein